MLRPPTPIREQNCPFCGSRLAAGSLYCEACGTDLSRSGATFSTNIHPVKKLPRGHKMLKRLSRLKPAVAVAVALAALEGLGSVPAVSARVPVLGALFTHTVSWGKGLLGRTPALSPTAVGTLVLVRSAPAGAQVQVNDQQLGTTPLSVDLQPGTYRVIVSREGYPSVSRTIEVQDIPVTVEVSLFGGEAQTPQAPQTAAAPRVAQPAPRPAAPRPLLAAGTPAPPLALKDRLGVIHQMESPGTGKTAVLFVWTLDEDTQQVIRELDARVRRTNGRFSGFVVVMQPDRARVRSFLLAQQLKVPLVFGTPQVANQYHLTPQVNVLYLVSQRATIERVQNGKIWPATFIQ
jgi:hypothetical protein